MASFVTTSLDIIRRHKRNRRPRMHSRWGDVDITAPIDGAWSQYNNPHLKGKKLYGPGFVPGATGGNKEVLLLDDEYSSDDDEEEEEEEEDQVEGKEAEREEKEEEGDTKKRDSRTRRLTRILLPSNVNTQTKTAEEKPIEFEYKPIHPNYAQELAEKRDIEARPNFRYVPASEAYFRELQEFSNNNNNTHGGDDVGAKKHSIKRKPVPQRSHSCDPYVVSDVVFVAETREAIPGTLPSNTMSRKTTITSSRKHSKQKESSDQTRGRSKPNQQNLDVQRSQSAAVRRQSHRRTMTLDMVGDQEDLW
ncbi:uncharacterized protein TRUGW13939_00791 [Talaromyces rugulosus]|uniref:Uncharacterized protein n=1 Tax=Talaromyces rugulosus TaxID=121627 RepID=A0A7H8QJH9_TALRU|nr:uncharacterized protein TRUGW13939_00791 [Talaromyces rugulosus]QKX53711.1 hypothetical protein TRUGW13939_00791 [Talaromyces rugulosus]